MAEIISEYIDMRLLLIIVVAFISFLVLKLLYRKLSMPKLLQIMLTIIVIAGNLYFVYTYVGTLESEYVQTNKEYYIRGRVKFVSNAVDKIRIEYSDTNMVIKDLDTRVIQINIKGTTLIYDKNGKLINLNEIKNGDLVYVKTSTHTLKDGVKEITANKVQKY